MRGNVPPDTRRRTTTDSADDVEGDEGFVGEVVPEGQNFGQLGSFTYLNLGGVL